MQGSVVMIFISHTFWCAKIRTVCFDLYWTSYLSHISISTCCQKLNLVIFGKTKSNSRILFNCFRFKISQPTLLSPPRGYSECLAYAVLWHDGRACEMVRFRSVCSLRHKSLVWFSGLPPPGVYWVNKYPLATDLKLWIVCSSVPSHFCGPALSPSYHASLTTFN